jgi:ribonucleoside-diphosphate reductase alpha chain
MANMADGVTSISEIVRQPVDLSGESVTNTPGLLLVIRRNRTVVPYDETKIRTAIMQAFIAVKGGNVANSSAVREVVTSIVGGMTDDFKRRLPGGGTIDIEVIQNRVERDLVFIADQIDVARAYILYRDERRKERSKQSQPIGTANEIRVKLQNGQLAPLDQKRLKRIVAEACQALPDVEAGPIVENVLRDLFDGVFAADVSKALVMNARAYIEKEPNYTYVSARLLLNVLRSEALSFLGLASETTQEELNQLYPECLKRYIARGIELERLDPALSTFDLDKLGRALVGQRDQQFTYLGIQTLYDRYFLHHKGVRFELPQLFFMRVAMGLALAEKTKRDERAIEFYNLLSTFDYMSSTPTLFNAGTLRPQLASCFLTTVPDDLEGIFDAIKQNALLSKYAGGLGNDWTPVRAMGAHIKGTNGKSQGVPPWIKIVNDTAVAVNQGGKRKGAACVYLETWHLDIEEFLELRKNTGDERRRTHDINTANWIPDLFMKRVFEDGEWTLFSPDEVPDLHDLCGKEFEKAYVAYEKQAKEGKIRSKRIPAVTLWRKMLGLLFETGHPWMTFKDPCNLRSPQQHAGVIHSSNLCTEVTLNTSRDEIAVCNLGSINLVNHMTKEGLDTEKLRRTVKTAIRMLDNVIDINFYSVPQARRSNLRHRPIGLGLMGFHDALYQQRIPYASQRAIEFADRSVELISYYAIEASSELAEERGSYSSYEGSLWSQGILPIDSIRLLQEARGDDYLKQDRSQTLDWAKLRTRVATVGMRNSNVLAIAPTATISNICGVSQSIDPTYQNLYVKSNMSGEFTVINPYLANDLKRLDLWDEVMVHDLKYYDGNLQKITRIPRELKELYATAFEIEPRWLVEAGSRRQKWIDQAQSLNLYMANPSGKKMDTLYRMAWLLGLKTTYYLRSLGATSTEKSTIHDGALNAVKVMDMAAPKACAIDDPDCEACQ